MSKPNKRRRRNRKKKLSAKPFKEEYLHPLLLDAYGRRDVASVIAEPVRNIYVFPLLHPDFCQRLIEDAKRYGRFTPEKGDPSPGQEVRLDRLGYMDAFTEMVSRFVVPVMDITIGAHTDVLQDGFVLRYSVDSQRSMKEHTDKQSDISLSVPLNEDFEGGSVEFVNSGWTADEIPPGFALMFLGRLVTHKALPVVSGERFSLTLWSAIDE